jgi:hypothetical protein
VTPEELLSLRTLAAALPPRASVPVPREWLLDLLDAAGPGALAEAHEGPDPTIAEVAARYGRSPSTVRGWILKGVLTGTYKFQGRETRIPRAALATFEATQRSLALGTPRLGLARKDAAVDWTAYQRAS